MKLLGVVLCASLLIACGDDDDDDDVVAVPDAAPTVDASAGTPDAAVPDAAAPDASLVGIECDTETCAIGMVCCMEGVFAAPGPGPTFSCTTRAGCTTGLTFSCDGTEDCPDGEHCCGSYYMGGSSSCTTARCDSFAGGQMCWTAADCPTVGDECCFGNPIGGSSAGYCVASGGC